MRKLTSYDPRQILRIMELFFDGTWTAERIASKVNEEFASDKPQWNRQTVYAAFQLARELGYVRFCAPSDRKVAEDLATEFDLRLEDTHVVPTPNPESNYLIGVRAAEVAIDRIQELRSRGQKTIGLGLGVGRACLDFCKALATLIRTSPDRTDIRLTLHAISSGCPAKMPYYSPTSLFNLFDQTNVVEATGLFCQTMCRAHEWRAVQKQSAFREAEKEKHRINIVVNAMGCPDDPHDLLSNSIEQEEMGGRAGVEAWKSRLDVAGNVQYRPFTVDGPIVETGNEWRSVTLFELDDFVAWSREKDRHLILMSRRCGVCSKEMSETRALALLPLLKQPNLRVFTDIVVDEDIAAKALKAARIPTVPKVKRKKAGG